MERRIIKIKGCTLYPPQLINSIDCLPEELVSLNYKMRESYFSMRRVIQIFADNYNKGLDSIGTEKEEIFTHFDFPIPAEKRLPEAFDEMFSTLERTLGVDLTPLIKRCEVYSTRMLEREKEKEQKEENRREFIHQLLIKNDIKEENEMDTLKRIGNLVLIHKAKCASPSYDAKEEEERVTILWGEILLLSLFSDVITYSILERLVENELVEEKEITDLLEKRYGIDRDYEWYMEDAVTLNSDDKTDIKIEDIMTLIEKRVDAVIGASV